MLRFLRRAFLGMDRQLVLFLASMALLGASSGMFETTFNNFLSDTFNLSAGTRGLLEFPRELPGFLTALFAGLLCFVPETRIAAGSALAIGVGMLGLALLGRQWHPMLLCMTLWSVGSHLIMPVRSSIGMALAWKEQQGRRLGQIQGTATAAGIVGCGVVWFVMRALHADYRIIFLLGGLGAIAAAGILLKMRMPNAHLERPRFLWRRRYWLYYVLAFLFGARKQVFITFGPWVLVQVFHQPAYIFAELWIAAAVLGVFFQPALGRAIDRYGERCVLRCDAFCIFLVCAGYGWAHLLSSPRLALWLLYACFVGDNLLFGVNMARDTYLAKIAEQPEHLAPTLSLGISINHAVSMSVPAVGGLLWLKFGHPAVFMAAAGIAVVMFFFSSLVQVPPVGRAPGRP